MIKEIIKLTDEEIEGYQFDFTDTTGPWTLRDEEYHFIEEINTSKYSDGPSWETIVQRKSDGKYFKWSCWESSRDYIMSNGDNTLEEVFLEKVMKNIWK
jgi:hypothetical protein